MNLIVGAIILTVVFSERMLNTTTNNKLWLTKGKYIGKIHSNSII